MRGRKGRSQSGDVVILHIVARERWEAETQGGRPYRGETLDVEGFIHCSRPDQVLATAARFFAGRRGLVLVCIDPARLEVELRYEDPGEGTAFPHIYGPLDPRAVLRVLPFEPDPDGSFRLPAGLVGS